MILRGLPNVLQKLKENIWGWGKGRHSLLFRCSIYIQLWSRIKLSFQVHLAIQKTYFYIFFWNESWGTGLSLYCCWWKARNCLDLCLQRNRQGARKCAEQNYRTGWIWHVTPNQKESLEQVYLPGKKNCFIERLIFRLVWEI